MNLQAKDFNFPVAAAAASRRSRLFPVNIWPRTPRRPSGDLEWSASIVCKKWKAYCHSQNIHKLYIIATHPICLTLGSIKKKKHNSSSSSSELWFTKTRKNVNIALLYRGMEIPERFWLVSAITLMMLTNQNDLVCAKNADNTIFIKGTPCSKRRSIVYHSCFFFVFFKKEQICAYRSETDTNKNQSERDLVTIDIQVLLASSK